MAARCRELRGPTPWIGRVTDFLSVALEGPAQGSVSVRRRASGLSDSVAHPANALALPLGRSELGRTRCRLVPSPTSKAQRG